MQASPTARQGSGKQQQPVEHFSANAVLSQRLWLGANITSPLLPQQGFSRVREEELRDSWCLLGLLYRAPCSRAGLTLPGRTKQTQQQTCSSVRSLGWHPIHTTISRCRHRLAFYSGALADSLTRPVLSPQERRGDRIPAHGPCTGMGTVGSVSTPSLAHSLPPTSLPHLGGRRHLTARFSIGLFLRVTGMAPGGKPKAALGTGGQEDAVPFGPEAQDRPAFCPDSFLRVEHKPLP